MSQTVSARLISVQMSSAVVFSVSSGVLSLPSHSSSSIRSINRRSTMAFKVKPWSTVRMEWQDCTVKRAMNVPVSVAYSCYLDREATPQWMPLVSSVKILEDKPEITWWSLKYEVFGSNLEFSWLAPYMQPIPNQKIHWRSLEGLPNRGAVCFFPKGSSTCLVEVSFH
ncbi:uncharacterized protein LOC143634783 [Bidens hawaiensis]|uniref:uncharacterized protein LOC143634783 n=1 Tax=Bidens hawaiensis TaxID=980011 RepID=UPI00404ABA49